MNSPPRNTPYSSPSWSPPLSAMRSSRAAWSRSGPSTSITSACSGHALLNPYVIGGTILLIGFFAAYMTRSQLGRPHLRHARHRLRLRHDRPAQPLTGCTSTSPLTAGLASLLIVCAVGFVAGGPSRTDTGESPARTRPAVPVPGTPPARPRRTRARASTRQTPETRPYDAPSSSPAPGAIAAVAAMAIAGEVLIAAGMRRIGDLDLVRATPACPAPSASSSPTHSSLSAPSAWPSTSSPCSTPCRIVDLSLAAPATASFTYVGNAIAARIFLRENVDRRRWLATGFVCVGVFLLTK